MNISKIYRKRIIPAECILLKDDIIVAQNEETLVTKWNTLNPKTTFSHGCSCFYLTEGIKVSKIYRSDNSLLYWYCDIVEFSYDPEENAMTFTDLLADVIIYPDGFVKVVDIGELADAREAGLLNDAMLKKALLTLNRLLQVIYDGGFEKLQEPLEKYG